MSDSREVVEGRRADKAAKVLLAALLLLGMPPILAKMFGFDFLPSREWVSASTLPGVAAGLVSAVLLLMLVVKNFDKTPGPQWRKIFGVIGAPFFGFYLGRNVVVIVGPMILALIAGHEVELPFTVIHADRNYRRCPLPIELQDLPFPFDSVCGVPNDVRHSLTSGQRVAIVGRGTSFGIYAERLRVD